MDKKMDRLETLCYGLLRDGNLPVTKENLAWVEGAVWEIGYDCLLEYVREAGEYAPDQEE